VKHASKTGFVKHFHANAAGFDNAIDGARGRVVVRIKVRRPTLCLRRFVHDAGCICRCPVFGYALCPVSSKGMHRWSTVIEIGMKGRGAEPTERLFFNVQIYEGGKAKSQKRTRNLRTIGLHELRMRIGGIVVEERHVAHVHVRIDQSWYEKSPAPVDSPCVRTCNQIRADPNNPTIADNDISMAQRSGRVPTRSE
jgi:hypothetical protein